MRPGKRGGRKTLSKNQRAVLEGRTSYDDLSPEEQAAVRDEWERGLEKLRGGVDITKYLAAKGPYAVLGADGKVVIRGRRRS